MILSFRHLVENVLADADRARFLYQKHYWRLTEDKKIARGQVLISGTAEGVIFIPPSLRQILRGALQYVTDGHIFDGRMPYDAIIKLFITEELQSSRFLQPGDHVKHLSSHMGIISASVVVE